MSECLFCDFVNGVLSVEPVYEDSDCIAVNDINPQAPVHVLVIPKKHLVNCLEVGEEDEQLAGHLIRVAGEVARLKGVSDSGFRLVLNAGEQGGQTLDHLHLHLLGGRPMRWGPG
ncbi:MAG: histidine triad nucleotide-binding protein [Armatimonadetes bacterium CG2_30_59_28]|nr:MAG: histidine triad nucleotide-binding protein [Armatimonadetes bacterium CG2_30_59_28]